MSCRKSVVAAACRSCLCSLWNLGQSSTICRAVSWCHPQRQAGDSKPGTRQACRKLARPIFPVRIWVSRLLRGFGRSACRRRVAFLYGIFSGFQPPPGSGSVVRWGTGGPPSSSRQRLSTDIDRPIRNIAISRLSKGCTSSKARMGVPPVSRRVYLQQGWVYLQHDPYCNYWTIVGHQNCYLANLGRVNGIYRR